MAARTSKFLILSRASEKYFSASPFAESDESIRDSSDALSSIPSARADASPGVNGHSI